MPRPHMYYADDTYADGAYLGVGLTYADGQPIRRRLFGLRLREVTPTAGVDTAYADGYRAYADGF